MNYTWKKNNYKKEFQLNFIKVAFKYFYLHFYDTNKSYLLIYFVEQLLIIYFIKKTFFGQPLLNF